VVGYEAGANLVKLLGAGQSAAEKSEIDEVRRTIAKIEAQAVRHHADRLLASSGRGPWRSCSTTGGA